MNLKIRRKTANPVQTTAYFGVKKGAFGYPFDAGNPFRQDDFILVCDLRGSWIGRLTTNGATGGSPDSAVTPSYRVSLRILHFSGPEYYFNRGLVFCSGLFAYGSSRNRLTNGKAFKLS